MNKQRICGNCKHLGKEAIVFDSELIEEVPTGFFTCGLVKLTMNDDLKKGVGAAVQDGSGYIARLLVESDFGCNLFEEKANDENNG